MRKILLFIVLFSFWTIANAQIMRSDKLVAISGQKYYLHKVQSKQTLYAISKAYAVSVNTILKTNHKERVDLKEGELLKIPYSEPTTVLQNLRYKHYIAKKEDTLYSLAQKFHTTQEELIRLNAGVEVALVEGRRLIVPLVAEDQPRYDSKYYYHVVKSKDTFYAIARQYELSVRKLKAANPTINPDRISPKDEVKIPIGNARKAIAKIRKINKKSKGENEVLVVAELSEKPQGTLTKIPEGWQANIPVNGNASGYETEPSYYKSDFKDMYKMLVFMPLKNSFSGLVNYYKGMRLAMQENSDLPIHISVHDSRKNAGVVQNHLQKYKNVDFIVGPYMQQAFPAALAFANENTTVVSLLSKNDAVYQNENVLQLNTTERSINQRIAKYVVLEHVTDNIIYFNGSNFQAYKTAKTNKIQHLADLINRYHSGSSKELQQYRDNFEKLLNKSKKNIVVVPETNHRVVNKLLSALNIFSMHDIEVVGYYKWKLLPNIEQDMLFNLNVTYFTPFHYLQTEQEDFVINYKEQFGTFPDDFSFMGYETMQKLLCGIKNGGRDFYKKPLQKIIKHKGGGYENIDLHKVQLTNNFEIISE